MSTVEQTSRFIKQHLLDLFKSTGLEELLLRMNLLPVRKVINPLLSFLYSEAPEVKWKAVSAIGMVVARLAETDLETARVIMRRLMWNLNDESGGIGWGTPEAMGEIMARHQGLAQEYAPFLISYIKPEANFIEHDLLQRAVVWALGRLAHSLPHFVNEAIPYLIPCLKSSDPQLRGLAAWALEPLKAVSAKEHLQILLNDSSPLTLYENGQLVSLQVSDLASRTLRALST